MKRAIAIFDMDETLITSDFAWAKAPDQLLHSQGITPRDNLSTMFYEAGLSKVIPHLQDQYHLPFSEKDLFARLCGFAKEAYETEVTIKPGATNIINRMKAEGYFTCILTANSPDLAKIVRERFGEALSVDAWFSTKELAYPKSDPRIYDLVSGYFGLTPSDCILFDDAHYAIETAHMAGIKAIRIINEIQQREEKYPYRCIRSFHELEESIQEVSG